MNIINVFSFDQFNAKKDHCKQLTESEQLNSWINHSEVLFVRQRKRTPLLLEAMIFHKVECFNEQPPTFGSVYHKKLPYGAWVFVIIHKLLWQQTAGLLVWMSHNQESFTFTDHSALHKQSITALTHSHSLPLSKPGLESSDALRHLPYTQSVTSITLHNHSTLKHTYTPNQAYLYSSTEAWQPNKCSIVRTSQHTKHSTTAAQERCVTEAPMGDG